MESSSSSSSSPSKRARVRSTNNGTHHQVSCLVDGCNSDLSNCRDYHRRHKVCELHSKTAQVLINGLKQRFCQQCSRFHSLEEFDEGKRSCRKRLDGHNRRRRKPQPDLLSRPGTYFSNYPGTQMLPFSSLHVFPSTTMVKPTWPGVTNSETEFRHLNHQQLTFVLGENDTLRNQTHPEASICQSALWTVPFSEGNGSSHNVFCDRLITSIRDSDCALSLLSSTQTQRTSSIGTSNMLQSHSVPLVQPLRPSLANTIIDPVDSHVVANDKDREMFHMGSGECSGSDAPQTLPFQWQ